jgi:hypothetical protein
MRGAAGRWLERWFRCWMQRTCNGSGTACGRRRTAIPLTVKEERLNPLKRGKVELLGSEEERDA